MTARIALVGRPNVGKSTLFNRLVGGRPALVHDTPGLTRDRRYGELDYFGRALSVVDTGGLDPSEARDVIGAGIHRQAMRAIDESDLLILVVDGTAGITPMDQDVARRLRVMGKPIVLAVNKIDHPKRHALAGEFFAMGLGEPYPVSASHGAGVDALLEHIVTTLAVPLRQAAEVEPSAPTATADATHDNDDALHDVLPPKHETDANSALTKPEVTGRRRGTGPLRVAFIGRPNAGKSSLTNRLLGTERSLVHHEAGTTTDPVDSRFDFRGKQYVLVDTAGIRRKSHIEEDIEKLSVSLALGQLERADVAVLVIDSQRGPSEQDARLAGIAEKHGCALVVALNKSDLVRGQEQKDELSQAAEDTFHFLTWAPVHNMSATRGDGVDRLIGLIDKVAAEHQKRVTTSELNRFFAEVIETTPPPLHRGRAVRVHYLTQVASRPPTFVLWSNQPHAMAPSYKRFLVNQLRKRYGFLGTPIRLFLRNKAQPDEGEA